MDALLPTLTVLRVASILDIVEVKLDDFIRKHNHSPSLIKVNYTLRPALTTELIRRTHIAPDCAVAEPFWLGGVPVIYARDIGDYYIELSNKRLGSVEIF